MIPRPNSAPWEFPGRQETLDYLAGTHPPLAEKLASFWDGGSGRGGPGSGDPGARGGLGSGIRWGARPQDALPRGWRTLVMGVLNVTPDSFSDGGRYATVEAAVARGLEMVQAGADVLDIGGESTRPGADPVPPVEEMRRVLPVVEALAPQVQVPISVDTYKAEVAEAALRAGARLVNDVTALRGDPRMARVVAEHGAGLVLMHMQGEPRTMQKAPRYQSVVGEIFAFLARQAEEAQRAGVAAGALWVDPGIGFGKNLEHNLELLGSLRAFSALGYPVVVGPSRKSFIGGLLGLPVDQRCEATAATVALAVAQGVDMVRVHDVEPLVRVARMSDALVRGWRRHRVYLALGSNLGDRRETLVRAVQAIGRWPDTTLEGCSSIYETDPVGYTDQGAFLNMVLAVTTGLDPWRVLREAQALELQAGRDRRGPRWGPRTLDVDVLLFDDVTSSEEWLTLPHPRMDERAFVLVPLGELAPGLRWGGKTVEDRLRELEARDGDWTSSVRRVLPPPA